MSLSRSLVGTLAVLVFGGPALAVEPLDPAVTVSRPDWTVEQLVVLLKER